MDGQVNMMDGQVNVMDGEVNVTNGQVNVMDGQVDRQNCYINIVCQCTDERKKVVDLERNAQQREL